MMKHRMLRVILIMIIVFCVGCGDKNEMKTDIQATDFAQQEKDVSKNQTDAEVSKIVPNAEGVGSSEDASKGEDIDYLGIHGSILDRIYTWVMDGTEGTHIADGEQVIVDTINTLGSDANYDLGYAIEEVNDNGIPDLLIGETTQEGKGNMIYAIYTWKDGNFQCNVEGAEYVNILPGCINEAQVIYFTPFAYYEPGSKLEADVEFPSMKEAPVCAQWIEDTYLEPNGYDVFTADDLTEQRQVVFIAIFEVEDFKVLALEYEDVDADGNVKFATETLYSQDELRPQRPLMVGMSCDSTIPCYGISYVDENGVERKFAIEVSGMDGSILLSEF